MPPANDEFVMDVDSESEDSAADEEPGRKFSPFLRQLWITDLSEDTIVFKVPQKNGCTETIEIPSTTSFESFKFRLAEIMDISVNKLNVGYTLSTWALKELPAALSKVSHLVGLLETLAKEKDRLEKAKKKGNNVRDLFVKIKDLNDAKGGRAKAKGKKVSPSLSFEIDVLTHKHRLRVRRQIASRRAAATVRAATKILRLQRSYPPLGLLNSTLRSSVIG